MADRLARLAERTGLSAEELRVFSGEEGLCPEQADHMVENALGTVAVPLGLCVNLRVNDRDWFVPMAVEECSVIAAASHAAKLLRECGGIQAEVTPSNMIGQIQLLEVPDAQAAERAIIEARLELLAIANTCDPCLVRNGGGATELEVRHLSPLGDDDPVGPMLILHLIVDVRDAMGANTVNSMCEKLAPRIEELSGGRVSLRIVSNLADRRMVKVKGKIPLSALGGKGGKSPMELARRIEEASVFAERDSYRAATHNKGIMNGIDAVLVAFGQDWRAVEAGAHSYAARSGRYTALSKWRVRDDALEGELQLPMTVGVVGGVTCVHPTYRVARQLARVETAADLASITAAVGLAQNFGALRALAAEGIQKGHMRVHARNVAVAAGAVEHEVKQVAERIAAQQKIDLEAARIVLQEVRDQHAPIDSVVAIDRRFKSLSESYLPQIMALIREVVQESSPRGSSLAEMCNYHMNTGGKRIRALLPLLVAESLGADPAQIIPFGAACEMLHNATLVHDDLQDGDKLRRGHETIWHRFGIPQAVNLGDAMFYYTLLLAGRLTSSISRREAAAQRVLRETLRVIDGQQHEFQLRQIPNPTLDDYFMMVEGKTSGLFALPMAGGAALCGATKDVVNGLQEAARHMGVLFQIQDDVLDLYGEKGRDKQGSDICEGKRSLLIVHALDTATPAEKEWLIGILDKDRLETTTHHISEVMSFLQKKRSLEFVLKEIERRREDAIHHTSLAEIPQLRSMIEAMCDRFTAPIRSIISAT